MQKSIQNLKLRDLSPSDMCIKSYLIDFILSKTIVLILNADDKKIRISTTNTEFFTYNSDYWKIYHIS